MSSRIIDKSKLPIIMPSTNSLTTSGWTIRELCQLGKSRVKMQASVFSQPGLMKFLPNRRTSSMKGSHWVDTILGVVGERIQTITKRDLKAKEMKKRVLEKSEQLMGMETNRREGLGKRKWMRKVMRRRFDPGSSVEDHFRIVTMRKRTGRGRVLIQLSTFFTSHLSPRQPSTRFLSKHFVSKRSIQMISNKPNKMPFVTPIAPTSHNISGMPFSPTSLLTSTKFLPEFTPSQEIEETHTESVPLSSLMHLQSPRGMCSPQESGMPPGSGMMKQSALPIPIANLSSEIMLNSSTISSLQLEEIGNLKSSTSTKPFVVSSGGATTSFLPIPPSSTQCT